YEEIAGVLGIAINPTTGLPDLAKYPAGIDILDIVYPLFRLGWSAAVIVTREGFREAQVGRHGPSSDQLKAALSCYHRLCRQRSCCRKSFPGVGWNYSHRLLHWRTSVTRQYRNP